MAHSTRRIWLKRQLHVYRHITCALHLLRLREEDDVHHDRSMAKPDQDATSSAVTSCWCCLQIYPGHAAVWDAMRSRRRKKGSCHMDNFQQVYFLILSHTADCMVIVKFLMSLHGTLYEYKSGAPASMSITARPGSDAPPCKPKANRACYIPNHLGDGCFHIIN